MQKAFKHPLARRATLAKARQRDGVEGTFLVIVTTMDLDAGAKGFSPKNFNRLHEAARAFLAESGDISGYMIINRPKDWDG